MCNGWYARFILSCEEAFLARESVVWNNLVRCINVGFYAPACAYGNWDD